MPAAEALRFTSLADALRPRPRSAEALAAPETLPATSPGAGAPPPVTPAQNGPSPANPAPAEVMLAIRSARLFRAALGDAFDAIVSELVREIAVEVVARELRLDGVDVAALARRLVSERFAEEPLRLRVAPADAAVACGLPVVVDAALEPGDAILECRDGGIDARLGVRLAAVMDAVLP